jgi:hypothetical protein
MAEMHLLKQSTAATVIVGPVLDSAGAAVTTAVVGDFRIAKEGSSAVLSGATVTHDANGYYLIALTSTNTNTVGRLAIYSNNTAQSMGTTRFTVLLPSVYDAIVTNAVNTTGGLPAATAAISAFQGAISTYAGGAVAGITGVTFPANLGVLQINSSGHISRVTLVDTTTTNTDMRGTDGAMLAASYVAPPTAGTIADAVWDEDNRDHVAAHSTGKNLDQIRRANQLIEGTVESSPSPTTTVFKISGADYPTGAMEHSILMFDDGANNKQNSPILTWVNNGDGTVTVTLEEPLTSAPTAGDLVIISPLSHVHSVAAIQAGLATVDNQRFLLSILAGAISNAGTSAEAYAIALGGSTYTVTYAGLDATGNRGTTTLVKT